jgi:hypothetical protein
MKYLIEVHPWDFAEQGLDSTLGQIAAMGVRGVSITATWPGRAVLRPRAAAQRLYFPERGAVYFKPDEERWLESDLKPRMAELVMIEDYLETVPVRAQREGLSVEGRIVFLPYVPPVTIKTRKPGQTGKLFSADRLYVKNAFGDRLPGYLCPAHDEVREYFTKLVSDMTKHGVSSVALESYGFPLFDFSRMPGAEVLAATPVAQFLMGVCFCEACTARGEATNIEISPLAWRVRNFLERVLSGEETDVPPLTESPDGLAEIDDLLPAYLRVRNDIVGTLVRDLRAGLRKDVDITAVSGSRWPSWQAWREGGEVARLSAGSDVIRLQGDAPDAVGLVLDVSRARDRAANRAKIGVRLTPGPPYASDYDAFAKKVAVGKDLSLESVVFSGFGELAQAHLKWIPDAIEASG